MSRLASNKPEDIEWRVREMRVSSAIEGIILDEKHEKIYQYTIDKRMSVDESVKYIVDLLKNKNT